MLLVTMPLWAGNAADVFNASKTAQQYGQASGRQRIALANSMFKACGELLDTVYVADGKMESTFLDGLFYYCAAYHTWDKGSYAEALPMSQKAVTMLAKTDSTDYYTDALALITILYTRLSDFTTAAKYAEKTLSLDRKSGDKANISSSLNTIAGIWSAANQPAKAEKYIREALAIERTLDRPDILAIRLGLASEILLKTGKLNEALTMAQEALKKEPNKQRVPVRQSQLGAVLLAMKRYSEARQMLQQAREGLATGNDNSLCITLNQLAKLSMAEKKDSEAAGYLRQSLAICQQNGNRMLESQTALMLYNALKTSSPAEAMRFLELHSTISDTLYNDKLAEQLQLFNVKYDTAEKQHQLDIQHEQIVLHRLWIALLAGVVVAVVIVALLMWRLARIRAKKNEVLRKACVVKDELLSIAQAEKIEAETARQQLLDVAGKIDSMGDMPEVKLTKRETQMVVLFCQGLLSKEIADQLGISVRTVETHKSNIYKKIGINNSVELLHYAQQKGLV